MLPVRRWSLPTSLSVRGREVPWPEQLGCQHQPDDPGDPDSRGCRGEWNGQRQPGGEGSNVQGSPRKVERRQEIRFGVDCSQQVCPSPQRGNAAIIFASHGVSCGGATASTAPAPSPAEGPAPASTLPSPAATPASWWAPSFKKTPAPVPEPPSAADKGEEKWNNM